MADRCLNLKSFRLACRCRMTSAEEALFGEPPIDILRQAGFARVMTEPAGVAAKPWGYGGANESRRRRQGYEPGKVATKLGEAMAKPVKLHVADFVYRIRY